MFSLGPYELAPAFQLLIDLLQARHLLEVLKFRIAEISSIFFEKGLVLALIVGQRQLQLTQELRTSLIRSESWSCFFLSFSAREISRGQRRRVGVVFGLNMSQFQASEGPKNPRPRRGDRREFKVSFSSLFLLCHLGGPSACGTATEAENQMRSKIRNKLKE